MAMAPILFSALADSPDGTQSLSFHEFTTSCLLHQLKPPPNSAFVFSSTNDGLPPRKTVACLPSSASLGSTIVSISGRDGRNGLLVWSSLIGKPTPSHRLIPPGRVVVVALSSSGTYLATGSPDGLVMLWELSTGTLLASVDAHYKSITCLAFTDDEAALVTASNDSICSVWSIPTLIDESLDPNLSYTPYSIFSDHTLPICDVFISKGSFPDLRIFTASLDQTIKVWSPLYSTSPLLSTFAVPGPAHHLVVDPLERFIIVAYATATVDEAQGSQAPNVSNLTPQANRTFASAVSIIPLFARLPHSATQGGVSRVHASAGLIQQSNGTHEDMSYTSPRATQITALHLPSPMVSSLILLCGLSNGTIIHLSIPSLQPVGQTKAPSNSIESTQSVVYMNTFRRPPDLSPNLILSSGNSTSSISNRPVGALGRVVGKNGDAQRANRSLSNSHPERFSRDLQTVLKLEAGDPSHSHQEDDDPFSLPGSNLLNHDTISPDVLSHTLMPHTAAHQSCIATDGNAYDERLNDQSELIEKMSAESVKLKSHLNKALALNDAMWSGIVDGTLKFKTSHQPDS